MVTLLQCVLNIDSGLYGLSSEDVRVLQLEHRQRRIKERSGTVESCMGTSSAGPALTADSSVRPEQREQVQE